MSTPTKQAIKELAEKIWLNATSHGHGEPIASQAKAILALLAEGENKGTPTKAAEIREELSSIRKRVHCPYPAMRMEVEQHIDRALALLADMEREGEVVAWASKDQLEKLDFVGDMMVSSEKDETFSVPYDIPLYTHPSPTTADAKDSPVDLQEVIRAGDNLDHKFIDLVAFCAANIPESKLQDLVDDWAGHDERAAWTAATKPFRP